MDFNTIGSIAAMVIGLSALGISIWQGIETRKNYKLSVTPKLIIFCNFLEAGNYSGVGIRNKGVGPAVIESIQYSYENKTYSTTEFHTLMQNIIQEKYPQFNLWNLCLFVIDSDSMITPNEDIPIIWLSEEDRNKKNISELNHLLKNIIIKIDYSSLYNQKYQLTHTFTLLIDEDGYRK